jgi:uncharacterized protein with HEPN domain
MKDDVLRHLFDIRESATAIRQFLVGKSFHEYSEDQLLRSAVERKFEIIGEALNRIRKDDPSILSRIREHRSIISFRNILIHGYESVDDRVVWGIIEEDLENLIEDVTVLLAEHDRTSGST